MDRDYAGGPIGIVVIQLLSGTKVLIHLDNLLYVPIDRSTVLIYAYHM